MISAKELQQVKQDYRTDLLKDPLIQRELIMITSELHLAAKKQYNSIVYKFKLINGEYQDLVTSHLEYLGYKIEWINNELGDENKGNHILIIFDYNE